MSVFNFQVMLSFNLIGHTGWVKALAFTMDSVELASSADDGYVRVWNIPSLKLIRELHGETDIAMMCQFASDGTLISSGSAKESHVKAVEKLQSENQRKEEIDKLDV